MKQYDQSLNLLEQSLACIPTGSQTFSKSYYSLPKGAAPLFVESGDGSRIKDVDGNEYIDLINGLLCVSLGYKDPDVDDAIQQQLSDGISFSLPHKLELDVAKLLIDLIPCAQMVRFGKNGTDVTSAAIRLARAFTGKNHVAVCGYHGWQDWYIGTTSRHLGVPESVKALSHAFQYNDAQSLRSVFNETQDVAAVIMEPMNTTYPNSSFLNEVREICDEFGALLIFDEMITGFRFDLKGAQSLFDVKPDLATFGKGMANGMPLSALVGRRDVMALMDKIFFSGTFGGETLSLAAAKATINKMRQHNILKHIHDVGNYLTFGVEKIISDLDISWFSLLGHDAWKIMFIDAGDDSILYKSILLQELAECGVLTIGSHNISYAFSFEDADYVISSYKSVLTKMQTSINTGCIDSLLKGDPIQPVFKVR